MKKSKVLSFFMSVIMVVAFLGFGLTLIEDANAQGGPGTSTVSCQDVEFPGFGMLRARICATPGCGWDQYIGGNPGFCTLPNGDEEISEL